MSLIVLVPDDLGLAVLAAVAGVEPLRYDVDASLPDGSEAAEVMVVGSGDADRLVAAMRGLPSLRLVQTLSAGVERWEGRLPDGVALANARGAHGAATAEWAAAALLAVYRELPAFVHDQAAGHWDQHETDTLDGKRVLVLGAGDLARELVKRLAPFGARCTLVGTRARNGVTAISEVDALLPEQDAVVAMLPLTDETRGLIDASFLARLPDGAVVVNAARGPIVDTDALLAELRPGRLRAALDVTDPEPLPPDHPLWAAPGVLITPHVGGATAGADDRAWRVAAEQIELFANGDEPTNLMG
jgi:phosphoglycerate dehydrogenase-like enzyme